MGAEELRRQLMANTAFYPNIFEEGNPNFGRVPGVGLFRTFGSRDELKRFNVHNQLTAGIAGNHEGAYSIVLSSGYIDNEDNGDFISYTGTGGKGEDDFGHTQAHVRDQTFEHRHNAALKKSADTGRPVRVIRGANTRSVYAPLAGYRYDGLYKVIRAYQMIGKGGFLVCKFDLRREPGQANLPVKTEMPKLA
ncbi:hypothetical protein AX15_003617 [Amanita polypyramis BW_CC]|nr:hypothetical protein AX15_003617 [Amanita polypyramis BW_CC]